MIKWFYTIIYHLFRVIIGVKYWVASSYTTSWAVSDFTTNWASWVGCSKAEKESVWDEFLLKILVSSCSALNNFKVFVDIVCIILDHIFTRASINPRLIIILG